MIVLLEHSQVDQFGKMKRALAEALRLPRRSNDERNANAEFLTHARARRAQTCTSGAALIRSHTIQQLWLL